MIRSVHQQEEQLLEGVAMTSSVSVPAPAHTHDEEFSFTIPHSHSDDEEMASVHPPGNLLLHDESDQTELAHCLDLVRTTKPVLLTVPKPTSSHKKRPTSQFDPGMSSSKKWEELLGMDSKLRLPPYTEVFAKAKDELARLSQVMLTEEYCRIRQYQKELSRLVKEMEVGLNQWQRQKKGFLGQIAALKEEKEVLEETNSRLIGYIRKIEEDCKTHYESTLSECLLTTSQRKDREEREVEVVPFVRYFMHSVEDLQLQQAIEEEERHHEKVPINQLSKLLARIKDMTTEGAEVKEENSSLGDLLQLEGHQGCMIRQWLGQIEDNIAKLICMTTPKELPAFSPAKQNFLPVDAQPKMVEVFLSTFNSNRQQFLTKLHSSSEPELYFWHVVQSATVTFLGILAHESRSCYMELSFGDNSRVWLNHFLEELRGFKQAAGLEMSGEKERFYGRVEAFLEDVNELIVFRMMRS